MLRNKKSITLLELLISIAIMTLIVLALGSINRFSHFQIISANRRTVLQQEATIVVEHMTKHAINAIGDATGAHQAVNTTDISGTPAVRIIIDSDLTGSWTATDTTIAYRWTQASGNLNQRYQVVFYPLYLNPNSTNEPIATHIAGFAVNYLTTNNFFTVTITACWDAQAAITAGILPVGTSDNPCIQKISTVNMPSVSTN